MDPSTNTADAVYREHVRALATIRFWRSLFVLLAVLAPLIHIASWGAVQFYRVLESDTRTSEMERAAGKEEGSNLELRQTSAKWEIGLGTALPFSEFIGRCAIILLAATMLLAALVILSGRMAGVASVVQGFFLTVIVATMFVPWERLSPREIRVPGVFTTLAQLKELQTTTMKTEDAASPAAAQPVSIAGRQIGTKRDVAIAADAARFAALPGFAALFILLAGGRFGRAYRLATSRSGGDIPMKAV